jgi:hypothetical protein
LKKSLFPYKRAKSTWAIVPIQMWLYLVLVHDHYFTTILFEIFSLEQDMFNSKEFLKNK